MTPEQKKQLIEACDADDDVRIVTVALGVAATAARERRTEVAIQIRYLIDHNQDKDSQDREYYRRRLEIAQFLIPRFAGNYGTDAVAAYESVRLADVLMAMNGRIPLGVSENGDRK